MRSAWACNNPLPEVPIQRAPSRSRKDSDPNEPGGIAGSGNGSNLPSMSCRVPVDVLIRIAPVAVSARHWRLAVSGNGYSFGGPGFHRHSPFGALAHKVPLSSSYRQVTDAPNLPSAPSQAAPVSRMVQRIPPDGIRAPTQTG